jgi:hypothetical protein
MCLFVGKKNVFGIFYGLNLQMYPAGSNLKDLFASWWAFEKQLDHEGSEVISRLIYLDS